MAEKKISDLTPKTGINNDDEFVFVDKATTSGTDAGTEGQTSKIAFSDLKTAVGTSGPQGLTGAQGKQGSNGQNSTVAGPQGKQGANGNNSTVAGPQGLTGAQGKQGSVGLSTAAVVDFPKCAGHVKFTGDQALGGNTGNLGIADHQFNIHSVVDEGSGKYKVLFGTKFEHINFPAVVSSTGWDDVHNNRWGVMTMLDAQDGKDSNGLFGGKAVQFIHARDAWNGPFKDPERVYLVAFDENGD